MEFSTLAPWATAGVGSGVGFLMVKWFVEWLSGRWDKQRETIDSGLMALIEALQKQVKDQDERIARVEVENASLRERVDEQRGRERDLEKENDGLRKEAIEMREHIAALETRLAAIESFFKTLPLTTEQQAVIDSLNKTSARRRKPAHKGVKEIK